MLKQALTLWRGERKKKTTLQRRLILFFASITVCVILTFALLLMLFGINGRGEKAARDYMANELAHLSGAVGGDFGRLSVRGIGFADSAAGRCDDFFEKAGIAAGELAEHPELLEPLLEMQMQPLLSILDNNACSGAFLLLDATVNPSAENAAFSRAGVFVKKIQAASVQSVSSKKHYLRGPAQIARENGIELLGQWRMEYDITGEEFFTDAMETARKNGDLPLSRLYYWTGRVTLKGNSESGFLLCVPLRSADGEVFGLCGLEVSDRMFKQTYSPKESDYGNVFAMAAPYEGDRLLAEEGLIAGNYYLTAYRMTEDMTIVGMKNEFYRFKAGSTMYGGLSETVKLYPSGSPYASEKWSVAVLMPEEQLNAAIKGNSFYLFLIIVLLLAVSIAASVFISRRYLRPVTRALDSIRNRDYGGAEAPYHEINDLFAFLEEKDNEHEAELRHRDERLHGAESELALLADKKKQEIDVGSYELFLSKLATLTPREREVFNLYLDGKSAKEIITTLEFTENALKYHNRNIYGKLGVSSRRELLTYAALMKRDAGRPEAKRRGSV